MRFPELGPSRAWAGPEPGGQGQGTSDYSPISGALLRGLTRSCRQEAEGQGAECPGLQSPCLPGFHVTLIYKVS